MGKFITFAQIKSCMSKTKTYVNSLVSSVANSAAEAIEETAALLDNKVDKISGKGLSTNDYTTTEKNKLAGIASGAQVNSITGVKGSSESSYRTGQVNLTPANIGALPIGGGTITGDVRLQKNSSNYGAKLNFGDGDYVYLYEPSDDTLEIKGSNGINLVSTDSENITVNGTSIADKTSMQTALDNKVDKVSGKGLSTNDYTTTEKNKLAGIADNANNYTHPSSHSASMITQSSSYRFVSDTEKSTWNAKAGTSVASTSANGLMSSSDKSKLNLYPSGGTSGSVLVANGTSDAASYDSTLCKTVTNGDAQWKIDGALAVGKSNTVYGSSSAALGWSNTIGTSSVPRSYCTQIGENLTNTTFDYNIQMGRWTKEPTQQHQIIFGFGTKANPKNNFRMLDGQNISAYSLTVSSGADYAEFWEWEDGNPENEDRVGYFVTFVGSKIRKSGAGDDLRKVSAVSGNYSFVGNTASEDWNNKYLKDEFGRAVMETITVPAEYDEEGKLIAEEYTMKTQKINPAYDPAMEYIPREERPEWCAVANCGQVIVRDDGSCVPDGFCRPNDDGVGTAAEDGYYVMERISDNVIKIYIR